jgi:teichoic acid transport system ATP-binding protein
MRPKIVFNDVSKSYNLYKNQSDKLLDIIFLKKPKDNFYALKNISFKIFEGEAIGIVGLNGSGKSTLSNLLAQIIPPTSGTIEINGETSLIAISVGLNNQLSGLENIELKCLMHGLKKEEIKSLTSEIIEFADIGDFIDQPVKNYSSGMKSRLGFAISIHTNPDILIVDEALSVGDQTFYQKCLNKMNEFKGEGKTIIFISHSISQIQEFCDRVIWMNYGRLEKFDEANLVVKEYNEFIKWFNSLTGLEKKKYKRQRLEDQYKEDANQEEFNPFGRKTNRVQRRSAKVNKISIPYLLQIIILFLVTVISASFMFGANPVKSIEGYIESSFLTSSTPINEGEAKKENETVKVNQIGVVTKGDTQYYSESERKNQLGVLLFSEEIYVIEQLGNTYKFKLENNIIGYTNTENIKLVKDRLPVIQRKLNDFLPVFPENFTNANEYFLTFLNAESDEVKEKLRGLTSEEVLNNGNRTLTYSYYDAQYIINKENVAESISINNINTNLEQWDELKKEASLISNDGQYYCFIMENHKVVVDVFNKKANISLST